MQTRNFWLSKELMLGVAFAVLIAVPAIVFGGSKQIYVDKNANGSEDGSYDHPYHSLGRALNHAKEGTDIRIAKGTYKENVTIPKGVKLFGKKNDIGGVVIKGDSDKPTVSMKHKTELNYLTIEGGRHGVRILENAKAGLYKVSIKKSNRDGIHIDSASRDKKYQALINDVEIEGSDRAGIFAEKRDIMIINSDIHNNKSDGVDLAAGMKGWLEDNRFNNNGGSGLKMILDGAYLSMKTNSVRNNKREGVEINAYGASGSITLKKVSFIGNGRYGIARVARTGAGMKSFGGLYLGTGVNINRIEGNGIASTSPVLRGF